MGEKEKQSKHFSNSIGTSKFNDINIFGTSFILDMDNSFSGMGIGMAGSPMGSTTGAVRIMK